MESTDARLVVVGGPSGPVGRAYLAEVRAAAEALGVAERIRWIAPQPHHLLASWYRAVDVVVVPSRSESFGLVALEAAACGTPVVAADVGGLTDLIDPGVTGELVAGRDPAHFAACIDALLADTDRATAMGTRAALAASHHTWETSAGRLIDTAGSLVGAALVECR
jgi:D-inositol-3-phosphate glycosyltransferase